MNDMKYKLRDDLAINIDGEFESLFVEINTRPKNLIIGEVYRIPGTSEITSVDRYKTIISQVNDTNMDCIIATDQNFDFLKMDSHKNTAELFTAFTTAGLIPTITRPTRIKDTSQTLIDNIYTNLNKSLNIKSGIITCAISDHLPCILLAGKDHKPANVPLIIKCRPTDDTTLANIYKELENTNWDYLSNLSVNESWQSFHQKLNETINTFAPLKTIKISNSCKIKQPWMTSGLLKSSHTLNKLFRKSLGKRKLICII